jgi:hypothetical protein
MPQNNNNNNNKRAVAILSVFKVISWSVWPAFGSVVCVPNCPQVSGPEEQILTFLLLNLWAGSGSPACDNARSDSPTSYSRSQPGGAVAAGYVGARPHESLETLAPS